MGDVAENVDFAGRSYDNAFGCNSERTEMRRYDLSYKLAGVSATLAGVQLSLLFLILGLSFSSHPVSGYLTSLYLLGEVACVVVAIPLAILSMTRQSGTTTAGRAALFLSIGVAAICAFFIVFPS
jgi:hypothetical protein